MPRRQTDTILVSVLIKTLVLFVSLGPYLLSRATHLCLFPALTPSAVSGCSRSKPRAGEGCGPRAQVAAPVSVSLCESQSHSDSGSARPRHKHRTKRAFGHRLYFTRVSFSSKCMDCHYQNRVLLASKSCQFQMNYLNEIAYLLALKCYKNWQWSFSNTW